MRFCPITEEELYADKNNASRITLGECSFEVKDSEECVSKTGNNQIKLILSVTDDGGNTASIFDYIISPDIPSARWKIRSFCESTGLLPCLRTGELKSLDVSSAKGRCVVGVESSEQYGSQYKIKKYLPLVARSYSEKDNMDVSDDVPF